MNPVFLAAAAAWAVQPLSGGCLISGPVGIFAKPGEEQVAIIVDHPEGPVLRYSLDGGPARVIESEHRIGPQVGWMMPAYELKAAASITLDGETVIDISHAPIDHVQACAGATPADQDRIVWQFTTDPQKLPLLEEDPD